MREYTDSKLTLKWADAQKRMAPTKTRTHSMRYLLLAMVIWRDEILGVCATRYHPLAREIESTCTSCQDCTTAICFLINAINTAIARHDPHTFHMRTGTGKIFPVPVHCWPTVVQGELHILTLPRSIYAKDEHQETSGYRIKPTNNQKEISGYLTLEGFPPSPPDIS